MSNLAHIIYVSSASKEFTNSDLIKLLKNARINNSKLNVSGILLFTNDSFFQVLEGEAEVIEKLFTKIKQDSGHKKVTVIINENISHRVFADWSMGFVNLNGEELQKIIGHNDFFTNTDYLQSLDLGRARKLLSAFSKGYWQNSL